jgi:hypothetical protein
MDMKSNAIITVRGYGDRSGNQLLCFSAQHIWLGESFTQSIEALHHVRQLGEI